MASSKKEANSKNSWLKRLGRLRIDEKPDSSIDNNSVENEIYEDGHPPNRTRTGVLRSFRKMHNRVKSCVSKQKFRSPSSKSTNLICVLSIPNESSEVPVNTTNPSTSIIENDVRSVALNNATNTTADSTNHMLEKQSGNALINEITNLANCCWYWGPLTREEAEKKLANLPDGSFLIRDTSSQLYLFSMSFRSLGKTFHSHIEHVSNGYSLFNQVGFPTIAKLIENAMAMSKESVYCYSRSRNNVQPAFPVRLTHPVSRFTQVRSLQYLCRFVIRQYTNINNISNLPIPVSLQCYLQQGHY